MVSELCHMYYEELPGVLISTLVAILLDGHNLHLKDLSLARILRPDLRPSWDDLCGFWIDDVFELPPPTSKHPTVQ